MRRVFMVAAIAAALVAPATATAGPFEGGATRTLKPGDHWPWLSIKSFVIPTG